MVRVVWGRGPSAASWACEVAGMVSTGPSAMSSRRRSSGDKPSVARQTGLPGLKKWAGGGAGRGVVLRKSPTRHRPAAFLVAAASGTRRAPYDHHSAGGGPRGRPGRLRILGMSRSGVATAPAYRGVQPSFRDLPATAGDHSFRAISSHAVAWWCRPPSQNSSSSRRTPGRCRPTPGPRPGRGSGRARRRFPACGPPPCW